MGFSREMRLRKSELLLLFWVIAASILLLAPLPIVPAATPWPALVTELENLGHPLLTAWLSHLAFKLIRARKPFPSVAPWTWVIALALAYSATTEIIQSFTGRDASGWDLAHDLMGAGFSLLLHARGEAHDRRWRHGFFALAALTSMAVLAPVAWTSSAYWARSAAAPVLWNESSMLLQRFSYQDRGAYPGRVLAEPLPDWRRWRFLQVELRNERSEPLRIAVRVHDRGHDQTHRDRYNGYFTLPPQLWTTLRIPLERMRTAPSTRPMDMGKIQGVLIFALDSSGMETMPMHIRGVRLAN